MQVRHFKGYTTYCKFIKNKSKIWKYKCNFKRNRGIKALNRKWIEKILWSCLISLKDL